MNKQYGVGNYPIACPIAPEKLDELEYSDFQPSLSDTNIHKLNTLAEAIEKIEVLQDGSLYMKMSNHFIVETEGHQVFYSKTGSMVMKSNKIYLNPETSIDVNDVDDFVKQVEQDVEEKRIERKLL